MNIALPQKLMVAALVAAGWVTTAQADEVSAISAPGLVPLTESVTPRRAISRTTDGLFHVGAQAPRTAPVVEAAPLLSVQGAVVDDSRIARRSAPVVISTIRVLGGLPGRMVSLRRPMAPERVARLNLPVHLDPIRLDASRVARRAAAGRLMAIDAEVLRRSRLARAIASR